LLRDDDDDDDDDAMRVVKDHSGDGPMDEDGWRAEPGSNGMALLYPNNNHMNMNINMNMNTNTANSREALLCQHGARRLSRIDLDTGLVTPLATQYRGKRFNGPNDVTVRWEYDEIIMDGSISDSRNRRYYAYFTDPVYAWLEKDRFEDLPYLDERVKQDGPGHCGVYRVEVTEGNGITSEESVELIVSSMQRPNGIRFVGDDLIVSDCCQGSHLEKCRSCTSRWELFRQRMDEGSSSTWIHSATIEDDISPEEAEGGCSDGFDLYEYYDGSSTDDMRKIRNLRSFLLASCFGGLCVIDLELREVVVRMWTAKEKFGGCKVSNVAVAKRHGMVILTGNCGISMIPLRNKMKVMAEDEVYSEL